MTTFLYRTHVQINANKMLINRQFIKQWLSHLTLLSMPDTGNAYQLQDKQHLIS